MIQDIKVEKRDEIKYLAIRRDVTMAEISKTLPPLVPVVEDWMKEKGIQPSGPCFFQYLKMENGILTTEVGLPVSGAVEGEGEIASGFFPAGDYVVCTFMGDYSGLHKAHMDLEEWIGQNGYKEKHKKLADGSEWGTRTEWYINDCELEPDSNKWQTDISFLLEKV